MGKATVLFGFFLTFARSAYYGGRSIPFEACAPGSNSHLDASATGYADEGEERKAQCAGRGVRVALICRATNAKLLRVKGPEKWLWPRMVVVQQRFPVKILKSNSSSGQVYVLCRKLGFARGRM